jgi:hypothetical protein
MPKKLTLKDLKIRSFVTTLNHRESKNIYAKAQGTLSCEPCEPTVDPVCPTEYSCVYTCLHSCHGTCYGTCPETCGTVCTDYDCTFKC